MKILHIEDSRRLRLAVERGLALRGHAVDSAGDGALGLKMAKLESYDVIILDLMLPQIQGLEVLRQLRLEGSGVHIIIVSAMDSIEDKVDGLNLGADDYLAKPFSMEELIARIEAIGRRSYSTKTPTITMGNTQVDTVSKQVKVSDNVVAMTRREYSVLEFLLFRRCEVVSKEELEDHIYNEFNLPMSNAIERSISEIRKKLRLADSDIKIATRYGLGYCIDSRQE